MATLRWALIGDEDGPTRTAAAHEVVRLLRGQGGTVGGFLQERGQDEGERKTFELRSVSTGARVRLATAGVVAGAGEETFCDYAFRDVGFTTAHDWVQADVARGQQVMVLDAVSKMEGQGKGHAASVRACLTAVPPPLTVLCVRPSQLYALVNAFNLDDEPVATLERADDVGAFVACLVAASR